PGALARLTAVVAEAGANIVEVQHQRLFSAGPIRHTDIELAVETMDRAHSESVLAALRANDLEVEEVPLDGG
ncbi:MAG: threonine ammonia-lyase, partial [Acidimicrobiales bacterium]